MKPVAYLFVASVLTSAFVGLTACDSSSSGGGSSGAGGSGNFLGGGAGTTGGTTVVDEPGGAAGTKAGTGGKAGTSSSTQGGGTDDTFGGGGTDPTGGAGTDPTGGAGTSSGQTCQECAQASCASEVSGCQNNAECTAIITCLNSCQDQACQQKCLTDHPNGADDFEAANNCLGDNCEEPCSQGSGGSGGGDDCQTCQQTSCKTELQACSGDQACVAVVNCVNKCTTQACFDKCLTDNPGGADKFNTFYSCIGDNCSAQCGG